MFPFKGTKNRVTLSSEKKQLDIFLNKIKNVHKLSRGKDKSNTIRSRITSRL